MRKIQAVEEARELMILAAEHWSLWKWLSEKKKVRAAADRSNAALDEAERQVKSTWSDDLRKAYAELEAEAAPKGTAASTRKYEKARKEAEHVDAKIKAAAKRVKDADEEAYRAHMDAEDTFAEAERWFSVSMAREGSRKAISSWDLHEAAIRKAEAAERAVKSAKG